MSNYPPGVNDDDPHFTDGDAPLESEVEFQSRKSRGLPSEPEHKPDCECDECILPF